MKWQEDDIGFLNSVVSELSDYLNSPVFDWQLRKSRISLTPGRVLLSISRLYSVKNVDEKTSALILAIQDTVNKKRPSWYRKIEQEFPRRLQIWENLINDFAEEGMDKTFNVQIVNRVILNLLEKEYPMARTRFISRLNKADELFRKLIIPGDFVWDVILESVFPQNDFWFLYCKPVKG